MAPLEQKDRLRAEEIHDRQRRGDSKRRAGKIEGHAALDDGAHLFRKIDEILDRAKVNIGRLVPAVMQIRRSRHAAVQQELHAHAPMSEVREGDDGAPADAQHVLQHHPRALRRLQGLRENDVVEAVFGIIGEVRIGVALNDRQALGDAVIDAPLRKLDSAAVGLTVAGQHLEEQPVAAADVEDAASRHHHVGDDGEI